MIRWLRRKWQCFWLCVGLWHFERFGGGGDENFNPLSIGNARAVVGRLAETLPAVVRRRVVEKPIEQDDWCSPEGFYGMPRSEGWAQKFVARHWDPDERDKSEAALVKIGAGVHGEIGDTSGTYDYLQKRGLGNPVIKVGEVGEEAGR